LLMGKSTLGIGYGLASTELLLAPFTPSNTARGAGIIYPIVSALNQEYGSTAEQGTEGNIASYLLKLCYQANVITSAMFLTAMAGNPLAAAFAAELGVDISWMSWCTAAIVPGLVNLALLPLLLFKLYPPKITSTPEAPQFARQKLQEMGALKPQEWIMLGTFGLLLTLWIAGEYIGLDATSAAFLGLAILLSTGVLHWEDILKENNAWHTFIWLATFLMMSTHLSEFGMVNWCSEHVQTFVSPLHWISSITIIGLLYFYSHYLFASISAHISSMYSAFALIAINAGAPPFFSVMLLAAMSSLCAGITHYGTGTAPVYYAANCITAKDWWRIGGILSVANIAVWAVVGSAWWKVLGLW
jgi:divalent anion:Na+ symporter, DASS family